MKRFDVWYMKPEFFRDGILGVKYCQKHGLLPNQQTFRKTHTYLKSTELENKSQVFHEFNNWGGPAAMELLAQKGLQHTSMSVGDIIVEYRDEQAKMWFVDNFGFHLLGDVKAEDVSQN